MSTDPELALALACARGDREALVRIEADYFPGIRAGLARMRLSPHQVDDVMQALRTEMFVQDVTRPPRIGEYKGLGSLASWLRVSATRIAFKHLRNIRREVVSEDEALFERCAPGDDPELAYLKEASRSEFKEAFQEALDSLSDRDRAILRMNAVDGLSVDEIGAFYGVHRITSGRWLAKAEQALLKRTRACLMQRARMSRDECDSMLRLVRSQLGTTLRRRIGRGRERP